MRKRIYAAAFVAACALAPVAANAAIVTCTGSVTDANGSASCTDLAGTSPFYSGFMSETRLATGDFTTQYLFDFPEAGSTISSLISAGPGITFTSVLFDAIPYVIAPGGASASLAPTVTFFGQHTVTVTGTASIPGAYSGPITLVGGLVPEPGTWAMMLVGFGAVGYAFRRRPKYRAVQAV